MLYFSNLSLKETSSVNILIKIHHKFWHLIFSKGVVLSIFQQACSVVVAENKSYEFVLPLKTASYLKKASPADHLKDMKAHTPVIT